MFRLFSRVQIAYFGLFLACSAVLYGYAALEVWPAEQCNSQGGWWDPKDRVCATPRVVVHMSWKTLWTTTRWERGHRR